MPRGPVADRMQERVARAEQRLDLPTAGAAGAAADVASPTLPNAEVERMLARMSAEATQLSQRVAADVDSWRSGRPAVATAAGQAPPLGQPSGVRLALRAASSPSPPRTISGSPPRSEPRSSSPNGVRSLSPTSKYEFRLLSSTSPVGNGINLNRRRLEAAIADELASRRRTTSGRPLPLPPPLESSPPPLPIHDAPVPSAAPAAPRSPLPAIDAHAATLADSVARQNRHAALVPAESMERTSGELSVEEKQKRHMEAATHIYYQGDMAGVGGASGPGFTLAPPKPPGHPQHLDPFQNTVKGGDGHYAAEKSGVQETPRKLVVAIEQHEQLVEQVANLMEVSAALEAEAAVLAKKHEMMEQKEAAMREQAKQIALASQAVEEAGMAAAAENESLSSEIVASEAKKLALQEEISRWQSAASDAAVANEQEKERSAQVAGEEALKVKEEHETVKAQLVIMMAESASHSVQLPQLFDKALQKTMGSEDLEPEPEPEPDLSGTMSPASRFTVEHRSKSQDLTVRKEYDAMSFGTLKDLCREKGLSAEGARETIVDRLAGGDLPASSPRLSVMPRRGDIGSLLDIKASGMWRGGGGDVLPVVARLEIDASMDSLNMGSLETRALELAGAVAMEELNRLSREAEEEIATEGRGLELTSWEVEALAREMEAVDAAERLKEQLEEEERLRKQLEEEKRGEMEALERFHLQRLAAAAASAVVAAAVAAEQAAADAAEEAAAKATAAEVAAEVAAADAAAPAAAAASAEAELKAAAAVEPEPEPERQAPVVVEPSAVFSVLDFSTRDAVAVAAKALGGGGGHTPGAGGGGGGGRGAGAEGYDEWNIPLLGADSPPPVSTTPRAQVAPATSESWGVTLSPLRMPRAGQPRPSPVRPPRLHVGGQLRLQARPAATGGAVSLPALLARRTDLAAAFYRWKFANRACAAFAGMCHAQRDRAPARQVELMVAAKQERHM